MRPLESDDPAVIGAYRLLGVLGVGGMGRVYLGRTAGGRTVAVKVVRPDLSGDGEFRTRFRREVAAARRVQGRYTVPVLDADVDAARPWLATGFVAGLSLREAVDNYGPLPESSLLPLAAGLARALVDIHATGLVHRDLKPSNVLLAVDGPKVIDFGIARAADDSALTTTGKVIGSPGYMSPEQITGTTPVGPAADVFALGGALVYAAGGTGPFGDGDSISMLWRVVQEQPQLDALPDSLRPLVQACLDKDPARRPDAAALAARFTVPEGGGSSGWLPSPVLEDISRRVVALLDLEAVQLPVDATVTGPQQAGSRSGSVPSGPHSGIGYPGTAAGYPGGGFAGGAQYPPMPYPDPSRVAQTMRHDRPVTPPRRRLLVPIAVAAGLLAVAVAAAAVTVALRGGGTPAPATTTIAATATGSTGAARTSSAATGSQVALPAAYVGTWTGNASDGLATFAIRLELKPGRVGDELGSSTNTGQVSRSSCARAETLTAVADTGITLRARLTAGAGCDDDGTPSTVRVNADGTASYTMDGMLGDITGTLRRG
ncbi:serine/threonine-protein kinase [Nocardia sp. alder85J]|uniref:serine/threonine-protein kinase n=1 Tax=Nocardia sp. alder85J TaxID=2862949 RepID=UPI002250E452|nr:serine/threonine-protein kinase [Nocardia sp. alder85J]MCX4092868.1 serine/threonine-protein kinase [Nocardia sp. alder85J]